MDRIVNRQVQEICYVAGFGLLGIGGFLLYYAGQAYGRRLGWCSAFREGYDEGSKKAGEHAPRNEESDSRDGAPVREVVVIHLGPSPGDRQSEGEPAS